MITDLPTLQSVFKHYHSNKHFSRSFTHKMAAKTSWHIDMERNYVIVALCIYWNWTKRARLQKPSESLKSFAECLQQRGRAAILSIGDADAVQYAGIAMRTRSIYIDQCSSTSNSWCLLNDRTHSRGIHYMHACSSAFTSANCSQSLHICRYTCSGQNFSGHVTWLMCIFNSDNNLLSTGL